MAKTCRIDKITIAPNGGPVELFYTFGSPPLSAAPSNASSQWANATDFAAALDALEDKLTAEDHALLAYMAYTKSTGDVNLKFPDALKGKTITTDFAAGGAAVLAL